MAESLNPYNGKPKPERLDQLLELAAERCEVYSDLHNRSEAQKVASPMRKLAEELRRGDFTKASAESIPGWEAVIFRKNHPVPPRLYSRIDPYASTNDGYAKTLAMELRFLVDEFLERWHASAELKLHVLELLKLLTVFDSTRAWPLRRNGFSVSSRPPSLFKSLVTSPVNFEGMTDEAMRILYTPVIDHERLDSFVAKAETIVQYFRGDSAYAERLVKLDEALVNFEVEALALTLTDKYQAAESELELFTEESTSGLEFSFSNPARTDRSISG
jgi:hypothetical protein